MIEFLKIAGAAAAVLVVSLAVRSITIAKAAEVPPAGDSAPDFTLPSQEETPVSLRDFRGQWVVLYFYPKDNTPGCTVEAHNFQRDMSSYERENAVVIGVSLDSADSHKEFCTKQGLTFKLLADTNKRVAEQYGSLRDIIGIKIAARNTFLISPEGKVVKVWTGVNPSHHSEEVLAVLGELKKR
jgi:peroxiredoxin Q/BCP